MGQSPLLVSSGGGNNVLQSFSVRRGRGVPYPVRIIRRINIMQRADRVTERVPVQHQAMNFCSVVQSSAVFGLVRWDRRKDRQTDRLAQGESENGKWLHEFLN